MARQVQEAYVVVAKRTPVGKAKGIFAKYRPDDLLSFILKESVDLLPSLDKKMIGDVIIGCAMPEAEQGMNVARISTLLAGLPECVPAVTINRFCSSGLQAISMAADRIMLGETDIAIAGGVESMSMVPLGGHSLSANPRYFSHQEAHVGIAYGMGYTAELVAKKWGITRDMQDAFALKSHLNALNAIEKGEFRDEMVPLRVGYAFPNIQMHTTSILEKQVDQDEGPRADCSLDGLAKLKSVFAHHGTITAGNASQMSDGAAALVLVSEKIVNQLDLKPIARFCGFSVAGVAPELMGIGPKEAIPKVLKQTGIKLEDIDWIELNEAFAAQSLAVIKEVGLDPVKVNPLGGAIALGHPLGATGAIRTATLLHGLKRRKQRYGMVTMCIGTGMGAAGIFEAL